MTPIKVRATLPPKVSCDDCIYQEKIEKVMWCNKIKMVMAISNEQRCIYKKIKK